MNFRNCLIASVLIIVISAATPAFAAGITIGSGATVTLSGSPTITTVDLTITGTLSAGAGTVNLSGTWTRTGTFTPGTSTVAVVGSGTATITGTNTFYNFSCTTAGKQINFTDGERQTITNTLTFTGTSASRILLRSTTSGTRWDIDPQATRSVSYVDCQDSYNRNATVITASYSKDSGNNVNWDFASQLAFTTVAKTLTAGTVSDAYTVQLQDGTGGATNAVSAVTVNLATTSTGTYEFRATSTGASISSVSISIGSSTVDFYYIDYQVGSPTITASATGLTSGTQQQTVNAAAGAGSTKWWNTSWRYRRKVTFDNSGQASNLSNFPALVKLTSSDFTYANAQSAGEDIRFMDADQVSQLPYEIEAWNDASGDSFIWVRVPQIDASSSTDYVWMYYGNSTATDAQNASSVWDANYKGVWHLDEGDSTAADFYEDSTSNANHGTLTDADGDSAQNTSSKIGNGMNFNGDADFITTGYTGFPSGANSRTVTGWVKVDALPPGPAIDVDYMFSYGNAGTSQAFGLGVSSDSRFYLAGYIDDLEGNVVTLTTDTWYMLSAVYDGSTLQLYVNDTTENSASKTFNTVLSGAYIGKFVNVYHLDGTIDEVRISDTARSADWIRASYLNQGGTTFLSLGSEQKPKLVFTTSEQTFNAGSQSSIITVQVQDSDNQAIAVPSDITVNLASTSTTGRFSTDGSTWTTDNTHSITISADENSAPFYYKDTMAGTATVTASESPSLGWTDASQTVTVVAGSFSVTSSTSTPVAGSSFTLTVTALDSAGATDTNYSGTVNLTVSYNSPSSGSGTLSVTSLTSFSNGVASTTSQTFSDCGTINIVATDSTELTKTGTSSNINMRPYDFTVVASSLDTDASGSDYARQTVAKAFTLTVTARNASGSTCPNYKGTANLTINYTSPSTSQSGSLGTTSLTSTYWTNGIATLDSQTYNKWGTITITCTDATLTTRIGTSANIIFIPKDFSISLSSAPASRTYYYTNEEFSATVTARDYNNSTITNYQGTIQFDASGLGGAITNYTYTASDSGSHKFSGLSGTSEKTTSISVKDTTYTAVTGLSSTITIKSATIKVISNSGPVGSISVQVKILDSSGNVLTEDDSTTFTVTITEFMKDNNTSTSTATSIAVTVTDGVATITLKDTEAETVTVTPSATPTLTAVSGTVRFGTVSGSGVGIQLWREIR